MSSSNLVPAPPTALAAEADAPPTPFRVALSEHIRAGYQILYVPTSEEARVEKEIAGLAKALGYAFVTWDAFSGMISDDPKLKASDGESKRDPMLALSWLNDKNFPLDKVILVFRDLDDYFVNPLVRRALRSAIEGGTLVNREVKRPLIITSPSLDLHPKLKSGITVLDFNLPGETELGEVFDYLQVSLQQAGKGRQAGQNTCDPELRERIIAGMRGLTHGEAENALARCIIRHGRFTEEVLKDIKDEKAQVIKKSEVLTYVDESTIGEINDIGGFESLFEFIELRKQAYTKTARDANIDYPKGVVLLGVPGTGKSVAGMVISKSMQLPLYIMDVSAIFASLVGQSEARMREAIRQITAQNGCVLLLDEADKALGDAHNSTGDSGVTRRIFGQLLSWLAAKQDRTFVVMTMNRTAGLPPELLRAGRFDAIFYTDLPTGPERRTILEIHFRKRGVDPTTLDLAEKDWGAIIKQTENFVGSELETLVIESRYLALARRQVGVPNFDELREAAASIIPLAKLDEKGVADIRNFCQQRARPVNRPAAAVLAPSRPQRALNVSN